MASPHGIGTTVARLRILMPAARVVTLIAILSGFNLFAMTESGSPAAENASCEGALLGMLDPFNRLVLASLKQNLISEADIKTMVSSPEPKNPFRGKTLNTDSLPLSQGIERELKAMTSDRWTEIQRFLGSELAKSAHHQQARVQSAEQTAPILRPRLFHEQRIKYAEIYLADWRKEHLHLTGAVRPFEDEEYKGKVKIYLSRYGMGEFLMNGGLERTFPEYSKIMVLKESGHDYIRVEFAPEEVFAASNSKIAFLLAYDGKAKLSIVRYDGKTLQHDKDLSSKGVFGSFTTSSGELYVVLTEGLLRREVNGNYSMVDVEGMDLARSHLFSEMPDGSVRIVTTRPKRGHAFGLCSVYIQDGKVSVRDLNGFLEGPAFDITSQVYAGVEYFAIAHHYGKLFIFDGQGNRLIEFPGQHQKNTLLWKTLPDGKILLSHATREGTSYKDLFLQVRIYEPWTIVGRTPN